MLPGALPDWRKILGSVTAGAQTEVNEITVIGEVGEDGHDRGSGFEGLLFYLVCRGSCDSCGNDWFGDGFSGRR